MAWTLADFQLFYGGGAEIYGYPASLRPQIRLHYHYFPILRWQRTRFAPLMAAALGLVPGDSVVIVGAGFNATGQGLADLGIVVVAIDTSDYILSQAAATEEAEIRAAIVAAGVDPDLDTIAGPAGALVNPLDLYLEGGRAAPQPRGRGVILAEDMRNKGSRNQIRAALASNPRYAISEEVLNSISDADGLQLCDYAAAFAAETGATIVHALSPLQTDLFQEPALNWKTYAGWRAHLDAAGYAAQRILPTVSAAGQGVSLGVHLSDGLPRAGYVEAYAGLI